MPQAFLDPVPQTVARPVALFHCLLVVLLEPTLVGVFDPLGETGAMQEPVKQQELVEALSLEDGLQVEAHVGLAAQVGGLPQ